MVDHSHCENCFRVNCNHVSCKIIDCQQPGCGFRMHECKQQDHVNMICSRVLVPCINSEYGCDSMMLRNDLRCHLEKCPAAVVSCSFVNTARRRDVVCCRCPVECQFKDNVQQQLIRDDSVLSSNIEFTSGGPNDCNYRLKPKQVCDSDFRRDEYCSHYQNVHCDIMPSLNGWMEKFCPNQQYGCTFSTIRIQPIFNNLTTKITFSKQNKAFGLIGLDNEKNNVSINKFSLTDLPVELILRIISYFDAFSLNNLSLTNKLLRSLCCNQLKRRGMVSLIWKKEANSWTISGYRWKFSNHFTLIKNWKFENNQFWNHLCNDCQHFDKLINKEPFELMGLGSKMSYNLLDINK